MKKNLLLTLAFLLTCQVMSAQTANDLYNEFKNEENITSVKVPHWLMSIAASNDKDVKSKEELKQIKSLRVLDLDECSDRTKKRFLNEAKKLFDNGYEELVKANSEDSQALILVKGDEQIINEVVIIGGDNESCSGVFITGNIRPEYIEEITKDAQKH